MGIGALITRLSGVYILACSAHLCYTLLVAKSRSKSYIYLFKKSVKFFPNTVQYILVDILMDAMIHHINNQ